MVHIRCPNRSLARRCVGLARMKVRRMWMLLRTTACEEETRKIIVAHATIFSVRRSDTAGSAIRCNTRQPAERKTLWKCGICSPEQTPPTHELSLVAGAGQRFESARRLSFLPAKPIKREEPPTRTLGLCQQYVSSRFYLRASSIPERLRVFRDLLGCIDGRYTGTFRLPSEVVANT